MKWLIALVALIGVATVAVAAKVIIDNRDPVPNDTLACARKAGVPIARSSDALSVMRDDAVAGTLRATRRWDWGRTSGVLIRGERRDFAVLALWNDDTPSLATTASLRRVYERPSSFPVTAAESPPRGALVRCALRN